MKASRGRWWVVGEKVNESCQRNEMVKPLPNIQCPYADFYFESSGWLAGWMVGWRVEGGGWYHYHERTAVLDGPGVVVHVAINSINSHKSHVTDTLCIGLFKRSGGPRGPQSSRAQSPITNPFSVPGGDQQPQDIQHPSLKKTTEKEVLSWSPYWVRASRRVRHIVSSVGLRRKGLSSCMPWWYNLFTNVTVTVSYLQL